MRRLIMQDQELVLQLASFLYEKKAQDIVVLHVSHLTVLCDYLVIASGRTAAQVSALADLWRKMPWHFAVRKASVKAAGLFWTMGASWYISFTGRSGHIMVLTVCGTTVPTRLTCLLIRQYRTDPETVSCGQWSFPAFPPLYPELHLPAAVCSSAAVPLSHRW